MKLDMSRGKPSKAQLDLSNGMMDVLNSGSDMMCAAGVDCRNYGIMDGIPEARHLLADMSEVPEKIFDLWQLQFECYDLIPLHGQ